MTKVTKVTKMTKVKKSEKVKEAIKLGHQAELKAELAGKKKLEALCNTDFRQEREYVHWSVEECRTAF